MSMEMYNPEFLEIVRKRQKEREKRDKLLRDAETLCKQAREKPNEAPAILALETALNALIFPAGHNSLKHIAARVSRATGVSMHDMKAKIGNRRVVFARHMFFYWARRLTYNSYPQIGRFMKRDHTTVIHGVDVYPLKRAEMGRCLRPVR